MTSDQLNKIIQNTTNSFLQGIEEDDYIWIGRDECWDEQFVPETCIQLASLGISCPENPETLLVMGILCCMEQRCCYDPRANLPTPLRSALS